MRVLLLSQFYPPIIGGEQQHVRNLGAALAQRGHQVSVATLWYPGASEVEQDGDVRVYRLRGTMQRAASLFTDPERRHAPPFPDPELVMGLKRVLRRETPAIVHAHNWMLHSFLPLKRLCGARLVVTLHDYSLVCAKRNYMHNNMPCSGPALWKCIRCAKQQYGAVKGGVTTLANWAAGHYEREAVDKFLAVSRAVARFNRLEQFGAPFEVIHNFVSDDVGSLSASSDPRLSALPGDGYLLFVGDLMELKGINVLLKAYTKLDRAPPLVLIGRECSDTPKDLPPNVYMFRSWPHAAVMQAWNRCLFGIAPSVLLEACATVVMEAMALGKPIVASAIGGMPDLVDHGETGLLVRPGDASALADAMQALLDDPERRERMAAAALKNVERLKAKAIVSQIEAVYYGLTSEETRSCNTHLAGDHDAQRQ
jgi:glycosyltransferase involved in cell wall biosynthesis